MQEESIKKAIEALEEVSEAVAAEDEAKQPQEDLIKKRASYKDKKAKKYFDNTSLFAIIGGGAIISILMAVAFLFYIAFVWSSTLGKDPADLLPQNIAQNEKSNVDEMTESQIKSVAKLKNRRDPVYDDDYVREWLADAIQKSFTYGHLTRIEHHTSTLRDLYTLAGINRLHLMIEDDLNARRVATGASYAMVHPTDEPQIIVKDIVRDRFQWDVHIPMERIFVLVEEDLMLREDASYTVSVVRSIEFENPYGIAIENVVLNEQ